MAELHSLLLRQLRKAGIDNPENLPSSEKAWETFLSRVSAAYVDLDQYRYTIERSMDLSSKEMQGLNKRLEEERQKLEALLSEGLCFVDASWKIQSLNPEAKRILKCKDADAAGMAISQFVGFYNAKDPECAIPVEVMEDKLRKGFPYTCEFGLMKLSGGTQINVAFSMNPVIQDDVLTGVLILFRDTTERVTAEKQLRAVVKALKEAESKHKYLAYYDPLTDIPNRRRFEMMLSDAIAQAQRSNQVFALLYVDIDHFKNINDSFGHDMGDLLLQEISSRLQSHLRAGDFLARLGGDEFAVILTDIEKEYYAGKKAKELMDVLSEPYILGDIERRLNTSVSIGIACYPLAGMGVISLLKHADIAMYRAKELGRDNYQFFTKELNKKYKRWQSIEQALSEALEKDQLEIYYQPIINLQTNKISAVEALLHWDDPRFGVMQPDEFVPIAEETRLMLPMGDWVLRKACRQCKQWFDQGYHDLRMTINLSATQVMQESFVATIKNIIAETNVSPDSLEVELTETAVMTHDELPEKTMRELDAMGISISVDDFGTGYSSLSHIQQLPIKTLKIDRSFVRDICEDDKDAIIVQSIITLAKNLRLNVIAEGVEERGQLDFLVQHGCAEAQGFYFSEPVSAESLERLLNEQKAGEKGK